MRVMMIALGTLSLVGCKTAAETGSDGGTPIYDDPPGGLCNAAPVQAYVGKTVSEELGQAIQTESGARRLRWGPPDSAWTMDFREDRVNVRYDRAMTITSITCG